MRHAKTVGPLPLLRERWRLSPAWGPRLDLGAVIEAAGSDGIGRAGIIEQLNVKGDKSAEQSVSNALANLKKSGAVAHGDGKYTKPA